MASDLSLLFALILLNGVFAMSEIAVVSSKRARLIQLAESGRKGAQRAIDLSAEPTRFLSTVQVGITAIGILSGALGEQAIAARLEPVFAPLPVIGPHAHAISLGLMVLAITYVSLIFGELAPKRLALTRPEAIASAIAAPMQFLARIGRPLVRLLTWSTDSLLRLLRVRQSNEPAFTVEELSVLLEQGAREGVLERSEQQMVDNVLNLDERHVGTVLTPRSEMVYLDVSDPPERTREKLRDNPHSVLPLCEGGLEHIIGVVRSARLLDQVLEGGRFEPAQVAEPPLYVPHSMSLMQLLEHFKRTHLPLALVIDEFGEVDGIVTLTDVISAIVGELPTEPNEEPAIVTREDGSWLIDGAIAIDALQRQIGVRLASEEDRHDFHTLGGLVMAALGRVPRTGDTFTRDGIKFEVMDMDGNRVDRVLVSRQTKPEPPAVR